MLFVFNIFLFFFLFEALYLFLFFLFFSFSLYFFFFFVSCVCELNRTPYDFSEGESELVAGVCTEMGSKVFTLMFLGEYSNILFFSLYLSLIFFFNFFVSFFILIYLFFCFIRGTFPRFRYDLLMNFCWKFLIPFISLFIFILFSQIF